MDNAGPSPTPPAAPASVGFALSQLGFATSGRFAVLVGELGLEPRHFALLRAVRESDGPSQQAVAESLRIPASTMVALIDHLESEGMLERRPHASDRRTRTLHLTPHGAEVLGKATELGAQWEQRLCAGLSPAERDQLLSLLGRVAANVGLSRGALPDQGSGRRPDPLPS